jgi:hypothetical protein
MQSRKARILRIAAVIAIALGAGHIAQYGGPRTVTYSAIVPDPVPQAVMPLAAETGKKTGNAAPLGFESDPLILPLPASRPSIGGPAKLVPPESNTLSDASDCEPTLTLAARNGAMIDLLLTAPCQPNERVVLRHAGLAVTYGTNGAGVLFASVPALISDVQVSILFAGGQEARAALTLPEADLFRRFGLQWMGQQAFQVNAFEDGADYGMPGHVSAADPRKPGETMLPYAGFMTLLGDEQVETPMLAEIYTFPASSDMVPVTVEATVTAENCGREVLGETLNVLRGTVKRADVSVTMPDCDAIGDYLVLNNLSPDTTLAAAD